MRYTPLEQEMIYACAEVPPDFERVKVLMAEGANIHAYDDQVDFETLLAKVVLDYPRNARRCDSCNCEDPCSECNRFKPEYLPQIIQFFLDSGWNSKEYGMNVLSALLYSTYSKEIFESARLICNNGVKGTPEEFKELLQTIGEKESYERCCEHDHATENLFYAYYEAVLRVKEGKTFKDIDTYHAAVGMEVNQIVLFGTIEDIFSDECGRRCFAKDIGFVCGEKTLIIREGINILFMNHRLQTDSHIEYNELFETEIVGRRISKISFSHNEIRSGHTAYGQPTIHLHMDDGSVIRFTHNFGEMPDNKSFSRFEVSKVE